MSQIGWTDKLRPPFSSRPSPSRSHAAGFSVLELLVSLALLVLIAGFITGGLQFGRRAWEVTRNIDHLSSLGAAQEALRQFLGSAMPVAELGPEGDIRAAFRGGEQSLELVVALPERQNAAGLYRLRLGFSALASGPGRPGTLVLTLEPFEKVVRVRVEAASQDRHEIVTGIARLRLRYFGAAKSWEAASWHPGWDRLDILPHLVGVSVDFPPGDLRQWPEMVVGLKVSR